MEEGSGSTKEEEVVVVASGGTVRTRNVQLLTGVSGGLGREELLDLRAPRCLWSTKYEALPGIPPQLRDSLVFFSEKVRSATRQLLQWIFPNAKKFIPWDVYFDILGYSRIVLLIHIFIAMYMMFIDFPVHERNEFVIEDRLHSILKCFLPCGRVVLGQVTIVKDFDPQWPPEWRESVWVNGGRCFYIKHMMERDGMYEAYDINPTPTPRYTPEYTYLITWDVTPIHFGG
ncbi:hypothetical protein Cgig2_019040 [Carnegiea gigantea]|uniref:Uncharacterized protein n=1 Tax=Carnegiea gigantea TaxID=171969 RepID=A0A9Q1JNP3_9CARY|nr:hypothetical protein Cgig2_019040 [Carnegiea gigantea]